MSRRLAVTLALVFSLVAATIGSAAADILGGGGDDDNVLPLPALRSVLARCTRSTPTDRAPPTTWCSSGTSRRWRRSGR